MQDDRWPQQDAGHVTSEAEWDATTGAWSDVTPYDPARGVAVMFSGREPPGLGIVYRDLWEGGRL